jgi:hypothetical protein
VVTVAADLDHLPADIGRPRRQQKPQRRLGGRRLREPYEIHRPPAPDLLAEGPYEPFEGLLDGGLVMVGGVQGRAEHHDPPALGDRPYDGVEGRVHLGERVDVTDTGGVENDGDGPLAFGATGASGAGVRPFATGARPRPGQDGCEVQVGLARREMQQLPSERRLFGTPAPQPHRLRQPEPAGQEPAGGGAGETQVAVGHRPTPSSVVFLLWSKVTRGKPTSR